MDNELLLFDRLEVIKTTIQKYGEDNFYLSFSGGKDSVVVHHLLDMALSNNKIPRVYINTGIEYNDMVKFVEKLAKDDKRIEIIKPSKNIKSTLEQYGYPFKSKEHSQWFSIYQKNKVETDKYIKMVDENPKLLEDYDFIHNLPKGVKWTIKYVYGMRERERETCTSTLRTPNKLIYQFHEEMPFKISDKCCLKMKEEPLKKWAKENHKPNTILGLMRDEGGRRTTTKCIAFKNKGLSFSPLAKVTKEWEEWFIKEYNIKLCELYYPPYNFKRTGCKGCPFNITLERELSNLSIYGMENERKQCEIIWKPVYEEYRRIGYRLKKDEQIKLF